MKRTLIKDLKNSLGQEVTLAGFVHIIRDQGSICFILLRDISGIVQTVVFKQNEDVFVSAKELSHESVIEITGRVKEEKNAPDGYEVEVLTLKVLSAADPELPIPVVVKGDEEAAAPTRLDYRWLDLRRPEKAKIFKVWTAFEKGVRKYFDEQGFVQLYPPAFMSTPSETGAEVFEVGYFDRKAYLAQSPQFYKQMGIASGFEKVFMTGPVFRAEPSFTTRHLTEFTGWDFEVGYIESHSDVMDIQEEIVVSGFQEVQKAFPELNIEVPSRPFPRLSMTETKGILKERGVESSEEHDISPQEERAISEYIKEVQNHDFVFITDYHKSKSPFYHMLDPENDNRGRRADLLYRGIEVTTLAQREHRPEILEKQAQDKEMKTGVMSLEPLKDYLNFFRYGCPPHGGGGIGPGRIIMKMLDLPNVREATYVPRDVKRLTP